MRYFIEIQYKGTSYHGWQFQPNARTVQEVLDQALSIFCAEKIDTLGCGRTDTGVHATQFYAHFDTSKEWVEEHLKNINALLPNDIAVLKIHKVHDEAHARFDATQRSYEYHIHSKKDVFLHEESCLFLHADKLDIEKMNKAAQLLLLHTDFACFCKSNSGSQTTLCKISRAEWKAKGNQFVFYISADRFLRNMVRAIVGTLLDIGMHKSTIGNLEKILESKDRSEAGTSVPAKGLYLTSVTYPYIQ